MNKKWSVLLETRQEFDSFLVTTNARGAIQHQILLQRTKRSRGVIGTTGTKDHAFQENKRLDHNAGGIERDRSERDPAAHMLSTHAEGKRYPVKNRTGTPRFYKVQHTNAI